MSIFNYLWNGLKENVFHNLRYLNTWSSVGDALWGCVRVVTLVEEEHHWSWAVRRKPRVTPSPLSLSLWLSAWALSFLFWVPCLPASIFPHSDQPFFLWNCKPKWKLPSWVASVRVLYHSLRKLTNIICIWFSIDKKC